MRRVYMTVLLAFMVQLNTLAQRVALNSVEEAFELSLEKNIDFQNYVLNQEKAAVTYTQANAYRMPTISGTFIGQRNMDLAVTPLPAEIFGGEPGTTIDAQFGQAYNYNAGISIYQELFNRENKLNSRVSALSLEMEQVSTSRYEDILKEQVSLYYYTALIAKKAVEIGEQDVKSAHEIHSLTLEKFDQGLVDAITLNMSKINLNSVKQNLNTNKQLEKQSVIELKKLFGMHPQDSLSFTSSLDYFLPEVYTEDQLSDNLLIKNAALQVKQADVFLKISQSSLLPTLSFNTYYGRQQFRDDFGLSLSGDSWTNYSYLSFNLSVPIFNGFANRKNIKKSKFDQQVALNEQLKTAQHAALDDQRLIADYNISIEDASVNLETYRLYQENQELTYQKYQEGLISLDGYLSVFEDYIKAENAYLNSMSKVYSYYSQILPRI